MAAENNDNSYASGIKLGFFGGIGVTLLSIGAILLLFFEDLQPEPQPSPQPAPIVEAEPAPTPSPDAAIRFTWVTDSSGLVIGENYAQPLIESSLQAPGTYTVHTLRDRESVVSVTIGNAPQPEPRPPSPPSPVVDNYQQSLQAAYNAETSANKQALLKALVAGWMQAEQVAANTQGNIGKLYSESRKSIISQAGFVGLPKVRDAIANEINSILPNDGTVEVTQEIRNKIVAEYRRTWQALEQLK